ncbi:unnamed protein product [Rotaria sp. Silwood2]|nr:unnamed protein product [Rotaria sp. Silwood2]
MEEEKVQSLTDALRNNTALTELDLWKNEIESEDPAQHLANALRNNTTLTNFHLRANRVGVKGARHVVDALRSNKVNHVLFSSLSFSSSLFHTDTHRTRSLIRSNRRRSDPRSG